MAVESSRREVSFPPLAESRYRVDGSQVRERYWYSDGAWLNQGSTPAAVGFVWTHWLADRGLRVPGVAFNTRFATELFKESQEVAGLTGDAAGSYNWAAAEVLQRRELIEACYACPDADSVTLALLERGPLILGLTWREAMSTPEVVDGSAICRVDGEVQGGHVVLLNGISRDLEIGGTTGFVRLKNSWGTGWGNEGQALISIEDLDRLLADQHGEDWEPILPVPARHVLGPSTRQDVAIVESASPVMRYEQESIGSDLWTTRDVLGYTAYVDAVARGIGHEETEPPLTIGIKAPWGAGKTSLMRMIRARLEWPTGMPPNAEPDELRTIHLKDSSKRALSTGGTSELSDVTYGAVLKSVKSVERESHPGTRTASTASAPPDSTVRAEPEPVSKETAAAAEDEARWRPTVWFNPWMYQTGEQVWAGLAHEVITQITGRMNPLEREHFWLQLNRKRIDEQAVRRKIYGLVLDRILPFAIGCLLALLAGLVLLAFDGTRLLGAIFAGASPLALIAIAGQQARGLLRARVGGDLAQAVAPPTELAGSFDELVRAPDYERETGFLYLVQADLTRVLDLVATRERPIVVFIDDLDRCAPGTVIQVIEAINLFLAGQYRNSIFVIAMEPEMVAAHVEAAYGDLLTKIEETRTAKGEAIDLGWKFLEKFVQLPLTLPNMQAERKHVFFESLFDAEPDTDPSTEPAPGETAIAAAGERLASASLEEAVELAGEFSKDDQGAPRAAEKEAVRRIVEAQLSRENEDVQAVISYAAGFLEPNPREIKRFVNVFRFFVMIQTERNLAGLEPQASLSDLAKLAVLGIRWPSLLTALAQPVGDAEGPSVFELLESPPDGDTRRGESKKAAERRRMSQRLARSAVSDQTKERLLSEGFRDFMRRPPTVGSTASSYL